MSIYGLRLHVAALSFILTFVGLSPAVTHGRVAPNFGIVSVSGDVFISSPTSAPNEANGVVVDRTIRLIDGSGIVNGTAVVQIELGAQGDEVASQFTVNFDPAALSIAGVNSGTDTNPNIITGLDAMPGTKITVSAARAAVGQIGLIVNHNGANNGTLLAVGTRRVVVITFQIANDAALGTYPVTLSDTVFSTTSISAQGTALPFSQVLPGTVTVGAPSLSQVSINGRVMTPSGAGLRSARVILTDILTGEQRSITTGTLGYYEFTGVVAGRSYTVSASSKRYRFQTKTLTNLVSDLTSADFTALE